MNRWSLILLGMLVGGVFPADGVVRAGGPPNDACGCPYERENVFEFAKQPVFRRVGQDRYEITFASQGNCDVTVGIVDGEGAIVRHLACGVLGPNAPAPFQKNSLEQTLIWDGKNDLGRYVESPGTCKVKVALGLKPELEKIDLSKVYRDKIRCLHPDIKEDDQFLAWHKGRGWECGTAHLQWYGLHFPGLGGGCGVELSNFFITGFTELYRITSR